jgi:hypothetical protein
MAVCGQCGAEVSESKAFCFNCGAPMDASEVEAHVTEPTPEFADTLSTRGDELQAATNVTQKTATQATAQSPAPIRSETRLTGLTHLSPTNTPSRQSSLSKRVWIVCALLLLLFVIFLVARSALSR